MAYPLSLDDARVGSVTYAESNENVSSEKETIGCALIR